MQYIKQLILNAFLFDLGQPILGPDGQPTYYQLQLHYANGQLAYVPNNTAYYIQQNGKCVPYYYMSGGGQQSQPQQVSPATVQTNTQHHPQQQQPSGSLPQQTQLQQQAQYYVVQTTPSGQALYISTQHVRLIHYLPPFVLVKFCFIDSLPLFVNFPILNDNR